MIVDIVHILLLKGLTIGIICNRIILLTRKVKYDKNKDINLQRNKLKFLEDRIATLEKSLSALNKAVGELQATEYERDINAK